MQHTFWRTCRAGRVQNEQWILGVHRFAGAIIIDGCLRFVQPDVATILPLDIIARIANDQDLVQGCDAVDSRRGIDIFLQWYRPAAANSFIGSNDDI